MALVASSSPRAARGGRLRTGLRISSAFILAVWSVVVFSIPGTAHPQEKPPISPGPLSKAHAVLEGPDNCVVCHDPEKRNELAASQCLQCHEPIAERMKAKKGVHREVTGACGACHAEHRGLEADLRPLEIEAFDHLAETGFPRDGRHEALACKECHTTRSYLALRPDCAECHTDRHAGLNGRDCAACHTTSVPFALTRTSIDHQTTRFPLQGRHLGVACASCHRNGALAGTPTNCYDCHWVRRQDDRYRTRLGNECQQCHRPTSWTAVTWNHAAATGVQLNPAHQALGCEGCHKDQVFKGTGLACASCHQADFARAASPNHVAAGFPQSCETCHRASHSSWSQAVFSHDGSFRLAGAHATASCSSCHVNNTYSGTPRDCAACHRADYESVREPNHVAAGFPTACETCHRSGPSSWAGATLNHAAAFQLVGVHATQACTACHDNGVYKGTPRECAGCHRADYDAARSPNHVAAGFPTACESCHRPTESGWRGGSFNHASTFQLVGVHATQACAACHKNGVYKGTPRECAGCHMSNYDAAQAPNHRAAGFPTTCESCHRPTESGWGGGSFNHASTFQLVGVHATQACAACHKNGVYKGTPRECAGCHRTDYDAARSPNHVGAGFPVSCESCHQASSPTWQSGFNHNAFFPLLGRHAEQACTSCHRSNVYRGTPRECYPCHQANYERAANPNHRAAGFPTTCDACHKPADLGWQQGRFDHTWFPISSGRHAGNSCSACHADASNFKVFSCLTCHDRARTDQKHANRAGYRYDSLACYSCHPRGTE